MQTKFPDFIFVLLFILSFHFIFVFFLYVLCMAHTMWVMPCGTI